MMTRSELNISSTLQNATQGDWQVAALGGATTLTTGRNVSLESAPLPPSHMGSWKDLRAFFDLVRTSTAFTNDCSRSSKREQGVGSGFPVLGGRPGRSLLTAYSTAVQ